MNFKGIGIVRKVDELGRIVLPKESRTVLGIESGTPIEILQTEDGFYLKKYQPSIKSVQLDRLDYLIDELSEDKKEEIQSILKELI